MTEFGCNWQNARVASSTCRDRAVGQSTGDLSTEGLSWHGVLLSSAFTLCSLSWLSFHLRLELAALKGKLCQRPTGERKAQVCTPASIYDNGTNGNAFNQEQEIGNLFGHVCLLAPCQCLGGCGINNYAKHKQTISELDRHTVQGQTLSNGALSSPGRQTNRPP